MSYYNSFVRINNPPSKEYREFYQELVNYSFENASTYYSDIGVEVEFGTLDFKPCDARITTLVDAKTGQRVNDDFKKLIFKDLSYNPLIGTRFNFEDNVWIVFSTDNIRTDSSSVYIRRCNNTINIQDKYGNIHTEPCFIDYSVTETQPFRNTNIDVPNGRISVQCQLNVWTKNIGVNSRIMFGGSTYKIRELHKYNRAFTFKDDSRCLVAFYADYDEIAPDDNVELNIANYKCINYIINIPKTINTSIGKSEKIDSSVVLDGEIVNEDLVWESTNNLVAKVDKDGVYTAIDSGECEIIASLKGNPYFCSVCDVSVSDEDIVEYEDVITPNIRRIKINSTQEYSIYEYKNGARQDTKFDIVCCDMPKSNYRFESDGNNFYIQNLKHTEDYILRVICTNQRTNEEHTFYIEFGGLF